MPNNINAHLIAEEKNGTTVTAIAWNDATEIPLTELGVQVHVQTWPGCGIQDAAKKAAASWGGMAKENGWGASILRIDSSAIPEQSYGNRGYVWVITGGFNVNNADNHPADPMTIRAKIARKAVQDEILRSEANSSDAPITVIVTAGPTLERIDSVMSITNMSTGDLGARIAETLLNADGQHDRVAARIERLYYLAPKQATKPVVPDGQAYKLELVRTRDAEDMKHKLDVICRKKDNVGLIVHSSAVGDYKARYTARAEDLAREISKKCAGQSEGFLYEGALEVLKHPDQALDDAGKMSSYEPNMMTMMDLTPKIISGMRQMAPSAMIVGFKLLDGVEKHELFEVASKLRQKNHVDYIVANNLSQIRSGKHRAMVVGYDNMAERDCIVAECQDKADIARTICDLAFPFQTCSLDQARPVQDEMPADAQNTPIPEDKRVIWQVIAANNMNTDVRVEGFAHDRHAAWELMLKKFRDDMQSMLPNVKVPNDIRWENGWAWEDEHARAMINMDMASVYDGEDMWYYNLVPVSEVQIATSSEDRAGWAVCGSSGGILVECDVRDDMAAAWRDLYSAFLRQMELSAPDVKVPSLSYVYSSRNWHMERPGIIASISPMSADIWDGRWRYHWQINPADLDGGGKG